MGSVNSGVKMSYDFHAILLLILEFSKDLYDLTPDNLHKVFFNSNVTGGEKLNIAPGRSKAVV